MTISFSTRGMKYFASPSKARHRVPIHPRGVRVVRVLHLGGAGLVVADTHAADVHAAEPHLFHQPGAAAAAEPGERPDPDGAQVLMVLKNMLMRQIGDPVAFAQNPRA